MKTPKLAATFGSLSALTLLVQGCGILGSKSAANRSLALNENEGCFDGIGALASDILDGTADPARIDATFDCADDQLETFSKLVKPSTSDGYDHADVKALVQNFFIKKKKLTDGFVDGVFAFKASFVGGDGVVLSKPQVAKVRALLATLRTELKAVLPHLKNRKQNPNPSTLTAFMNAVEAFGDHVATQLDTAKNPTLTRATALAFLDELVKMGYDLSTGQAEQWTNFLAEVKNTIIRGDVNGVGGQDWMDTLRFGTKLGGAALAYFADPDGDLGLRMDAIARGRAALNWTLARWNGGIPQTQLQNILRFLPKDFLPTRLEDVNGDGNPELVPNEQFQNALVFLVSEQKQADGSTKPSTLQNLLLPKIAKTLDQVALDRVFNMLNSAFRGNQILDGIYAKTATALNVKDFFAAADAYAKANLKDPNDLAILARIKTVASRHLNFYPVEGNEMSMDGVQDKHTKNNLNRLQWYYLAAERLLDAYGTGKNEFGKAGTRDDLKRLVGDFEPLMYALSMIHPDKVDTYKKRFREANLFTLSGNGDDLMDMKETTEYLGFLLSMSNLSHRMQKTVFAKDDNPGICKQVGWDPKLHLPTYDIVCFRKEFPKYYGETLKNFPVLLNYVKGLNADEFAHMNYVFEDASKTFGYDENPISSFDIDSYAGIPHYVESLMKKYDVDGGKPDGQLNRKEVVDKVWPLFKGELSAITGSKMDLLNKAVLLYLMQYGHSPFKCSKKPTLGEIAFVLKWLLTLGPFHDFQADRMRIFEIFAALSAPPPPGCPAATSFSADDPTTSILDPYGIPISTNIDGYQQMLEYLPEDL